MRSTREPRRAKPASRVEAAPRKASKPNGHAARRLALQPKAGVHLKLKGQGRRPRQGIRAVLTGSVAGRTTVRDCLQNAKGADHER